MPRYFLDLRDGAKIYYDPEGIELSDLRSAEAEALASGKQMVAEHLLSGGKLSEIIGRAFDIKDVSGAIILTVTYQSAVEVEDHAP